MVRTDLRVLQGELDGLTQLDNEGRILRKHSKDNSTAIINNLKSQQQALVCAVCLREGGVCE